MQSTLNSALAITPAPAAAQAAPAPVVALRPAAAPAVPVTVVEEAPATAQGTPAALEEQAAPVRETGLQQSQSRKRTADPVREHTFCVKEMVGPQTVILVWAWINDLDVLRHPK